MRTHWTYRVAFYVLIATIAIELGALILFRAALPPAVPLWHSRPWGQDQLTHPLWLLVLPLGSILVFALNAYLSSTFALEHPMFGRILLLTSVFVSTLSLITLINTLMLVI